MLSSQRLPAALPRTIVVGAILLNLLVFVLAGGALRDTQRDHEKEALAAVENLALTIERDIAGTVEKIDLGLLALVDAHARQLATGPLDVSVWNKQLARQRERHSDLLGLRATDAAGNVVHGLDLASPRGANIADREYFVRLRDQRDAGLVIGSPVLGRTSNAWVIPLARRLEDSRGGFAGVVYAFISLAHLQRRFSEIKLDPNASITLRDGQLGLIIRHPALKTGQTIGNKVISDEFRDALAADASRGVYTSGVTNIDGVQRLHSYRHNKTYGFYVNVGFARDDFLAEWHRDVLKKGFLVALFALISGFTVWHTRRSWRLQQAGMDDLLQSERRFHSLFAHMTEGLALHEIVRDEHGRPTNYRILDVNPAYETHTGLAAERVLGKLATDAYGQTRPPYLDIYARVTESGAPSEFETHVAWLRRDFRVYAYSVESDRFACVFQDITARRKTEEHVRLMASVFANSNQGILIADADNRIIAVNDAFVELTGYSEDEAIGRNPSMLSAGRTSPEVFAEMWESLERDDRWEGELWDRRKSGETFPKWLSISVVRDAAGKLTHYIGIFADIADRKAAEERVRHLAHHDALTGLPNRLSLHERMAQAIGYSRRNDRLLAVMLLDLDHFKTINDSLGHHVGDHLLIEVARRLSGAVRDSDIVARLGGDEFVVVLPSIESAEDAAQVAGKIVNAISEPYRLEGAELRTSPSIGISLFPTDAERPAELLRNADVAMYQAKARGRANFQFFTQDMQTAAATRLLIESELRLALEQNQFELHYQPQLDLRGGRLAGVEALVRWRHPQRGLVPPLDFIPIAEETGLIVPLGNWVLREACRQLAAWGEAGIDHIAMSVNLSAGQFLDPALPARMRDLLDEFGIAPRRVCLEVTESMSMASPATSIAAMRQLTELGVALSIDDFGTGYSSLAYLKLFPIRTLKIDRSFVKDIETDPNDADICDVTVLLAHKLGLDVVAEGVETEAQFKYLLSIGCEKIQGYLISKPLDARRAEEFIRNRPPMADLGTIDLWLGSAPDVGRNDS